MHIQETTAHIQQYSTALSGTVLGTGYRAYIRGWTYLGNTPYVHLFSPSPRVAAPSEHRLLSVHGAYLYLPISRTLEGIISVPPCVLGFSVGWGLVAAAPFCLHEPDSLSTLPWASFSAGVIVAKIAEASGVPYLQNVAKAAVVVTELLEVRRPPSILCCCYSPHRDFVWKVKTNKHEAKELCESIANTVAVINSHVAGKKGEQRNGIFRRYLQ